MWSSDYPHPASPWPHSRDFVARQLAHVPDDDLKKILSENVIRVYGLERPESRI